MLDLHSVLSSSTDAGWSVLCHLSTQALELSARDSVLSNDIYQKKTWVSFYQLAITAIKTCTLFEGILVFS